MLSKDELAQIVFVPTLDCASLIMNAILIVAIITRTPSYLRSYSVFLMNTAIIDTTAALASSVVMVRFINVDGLIVYVHSGLCTTQGAHLCHGMLSLHVVLLSHSVALLLLSFAYRVWVLSQKATSSISSCALVSISIVPSGVLMIWLYNACSYDVDLPQFSNMTHCAIDLFSRRDGGKWMERGLIIYAIVFFSASLGATVAFRARLVEKISKLGSMSERSRQQGILRALTAQALLPACVVVGIVCFLIDFFGLYESVYLQRAAHTGMSFFALASPIITLTVLRPYRRFVQLMFSCSNKMAVDSQSDEHSRKRSTRVAVTTI